MPRPLALFPSPHEEMVGGLVEGCLMEFFLRQPIPESILNEVIHALPLPSPFPTRLHRTFLLHRLNSDLSAGVSPSFDTLHFLKLLLDGALGASRSCYESLAAAYRAVILHCVATSASDGGPSFGAIVRELYADVSELEVAEPALQTLRELLTELRALLSGASESDSAALLARCTPVLFSEDTKAVALDAVKASLTASFEDLGPCFIELVANMAVENRITFWESPDGDFNGGYLGDGKGKLPSTPLLNDKSDPIPTPEFKKVADALKTSSMNLQTLVCDPLADAIKLAAEVSTRQSPVLANNEVPKQSLMDRNPTAHTYEWEDDSVESSSEKSSTSSRPICLPNLSPRKASPLNLVGIKKNVRRRKKMWTVVEEDALRAAVQKYGKGRWRFILNNHLDVFEDRTVGDLKDKWRNMTKRYAGTCYTNV